VFIPGDAPPGYGCDVTDGCSERASESERERERERERKRESESETEREEKEVIHQVMPRQGMGVM